MLTRNGVCYDLERSSYRCTIDGLTFVFSSRLHLDKFKAKYREHREIIANSLTRRFNIAVDVYRLADIVLYKKIETRGFLIVTHEGIKLWQENIIYVGGTAIHKSCNA